MKNITKVFISYAHEDIKHKEKLQSYLVNLEREGSIEIWQDGLIEPGNVWNDEIKGALESADIVIILVSQDFIASNYIHEVEMKATLRRLEEGNVQLIPILLKECDWEKWNVLPKTIDKEELQKNKGSMGNFQFFPMDEKQRLRPLKSWERPEYAWTNLVKYVRGLLESKERNSQIADGIQEKRKALDVAHNMRLVLHRHKVVGHIPLEIGHHFRDREKQREEIGRLLANPSTRIVSVIGRGGMGKTALVCKILGDIQEGKWPHTNDEIIVDGIVYLSTRVTGISLHRIFEDCTRILGGKQQELLNKVWKNNHLDLPSKVKKLFTELNCGLYIILLDNMEDLLNKEGHVIDEELKVFFKASLEVPHCVRILITSRIPISFSSEVMRYDNKIPLQDGLPEDEGINMLKDLDPSGEIGLKEAPIEDLRRAVEYLHGHPRALEVLAGILKDDSFSTLDQILDRFYEESDTVLKLIECGYSRLDLSTQRVLQALAVFARPVPSVAVDYILEPFTPGLNVREVLTRLKHMYMININRINATASLHPIDRDHAYNDLPLIGEYSLPVLESRAADYYSKLRFSKDKWKTLEDLEPHLLEFEHRIRAGEFDKAASTLSEIDVEALIWHGYAKRVKIMRAQLEGNIQDKHLCMKHNFSLGHTHLVIGPLTLAASYFEQVINEAHDLKDQHYEREAIGCLGDTYRKSGELDKAIIYLKKTVELYQKDGDFEKEAWWCLLLSLTQTYFGNLQEGLNIGKRIHLLCERFDNIIIKGRGHNCLSLSYYLLNQYDKALYHAKEAIKLHEKANWLDSIGYAVNVQGLVQLSLGCIDEAYKFFDEVQRLGKENDQPRIEGMALYNKARIHRMNGELEKGIHAAESSLKLFTDMTSGEAYAANTLFQALSCAKQGDKLLEIRSLLDCARASIRCPDLCSPKDLVEEALNFTLISKDQSILNEAKQILSEINSRI